jgi:hypothetical protein
MVLVEHGEHVVEALRLNDGPVVVSGQRRLGEQSPGDIGVEVKGEHRIIVEIVHTYTLLAG